jgi:type IV pilus assembly protein PilY1
VAEPSLRYADAGYDAFRASRAQRQPMVYVGANDGMLHAFRATGPNAGSEAWAYVPSLLMPELYRLADRNYAALHRYFADGAAVASDICPKAPSATCAADEWRTILVAGLNAGGRGYYALDITDPEAPRALWQYSSADDADLGLSFGNPVIAKRTDGAWIVAFTSGYNNVGPGDGLGHLYVLNAADGSRLRKMTTSAGGDGTPSGLARISAWVDSPPDNTALRIYGGDLLGNVWRFDINDPGTPATGDAVLLAELGNVGAVGVQPVTTRPELAVVRSGDARYPVLAIGTGSYLGASDIADTGQQSIYVFRDKLQAGGLGKLRTPGVLTQQTLAPQSAGQLRGMTGSAVDWARTSGWYVDLNPGNASPGERVNLDMDLQLGVLKAVGNVPSADMCSQGGSAWLYNLDLAAGAAQSGADGRPVGIMVSGEALLTGIKTLRLAGAATRTLTADSAGRIDSIADPAMPPQPAGVKRVSWRELAD